MRPAALPLWQVLGINAVPLGGLLLAGWSTGTTLALYWAETLIAVLLTAARIAVHRRLTRRRGHWRPQLGLEIKVGGGGGRPVQLPTFLAELLVAGLGFSAGHGILLIALLAAFLPGQVDLDQLAWGVVASLGIQLVGLGADLPGIADRPFAWIRERAQSVLGRSVLIHLALIGGLTLLFWQGRAPAFFVPFAILKLLADLAALWPRGGRTVELPEEAPGWLTRFAGRGGDPRGRWRRIVAEERSRLDSDEAVTEPDERGGSPS